MIIPFESQSGNDDVQVINKGRCVQKCRFNFCDRPFYRPISGDGDGQVTKIGTRKSV